MFSVPARFLFWGRLLFSSFFYLKKLLKKQEKYDLFPKILISFFIYLFIYYYFFFSFLSGGKDCMLYRKIAFYIFRLPHYGVFVEIMGSMWLLQGAHGNPARKNTQSHSVNTLWLCENVPNSQHTVTQSQCVFSLCDCVFSGREPSSKRKVWPPNSLIDPVTTVR